MNEGVEPRLKGCTKLERATATPGVGLVDVGVTAKRIVPLAVFDGRTRHLAEFLKNKRLRRSQTKVLKNIVREL